MPQKKSKNVNTTSRFTYAEMQKSRHGTETQRIGTDSILPFGYCCLSLSPSVDPVASPSGHIYSREYILEYILTKKEQLRSEKEAYERRVAAKRRAKAEAESEKEEGKKARFIALQEGKTELSACSTNKRKRRLDDILNEELDESFSIDATSLVATTTERERKERESAEEGLREAQRVRQSSVVVTPREQEMERLQSSSYWLPQFTPSQSSSSRKEEEEEEEEKEPPSRPPSPFSSEPLRAKDLIRVTFERDPVDSTVILCPVSKKRIQSQPAVLIKNTGTVMLKSVFEELALPFMVDPVTSQKFKSKHILLLERSGTGFAGSGGVKEVKRYKPTIT